MTQSIKRLAVAASSLLVLATGCSSEEIGEQGEEPVEHATASLFDAPTMDQTAILALNDAQLDSWETGDFWEYCGMVIRKANGQFRATSPITNGSFNSCKVDLSKIPLKAGESFVGYYHNHPSGIDVEFSKQDKEQAKLKNWVYYVISSDLCRRRYDWRAGVTRILGCG